MNATTLLLLAGVALTAGWALIEWHRHDRLTAALLAVSAVALTALVSLTLTGIVLACAVTTVYHRRARTASVVGRWSARTRRTHGVATTVHILRRASWLALRRTAGTVRPSHADKTRTQRLRTRTTQFAVPLCRTGLLRVWASVEDVILVFGGPRKGKSTYLAGRVIDAPGAVLVTSTRLDLYELTHGLRTQRGPVYVFNAVGMGDLPTTIHFDPLTGCVDPVTAYERATDLLSGAGGATGGDREHWEKQARRVLTALLHAAALGGLSMNDVLRWVANPDTSARQVLSLLRRSASAAAYVPDAEQYLSTNDRTRSSITSTIMPALGWLSHPAACAAASGATPFDVGQLLADRATVYLLGAEESQVAPLMAALTGHIARQARRIAAKADSGRLDPPLTLVLDEAALIAPVPLDSWSADMGGRGVTILAGFQSRAQLIARWGRAGAATLLNNAAGVVLFGGTQDHDDLAHWVTLVGERDEAHVTHNHEGRVTSHTTRRVPVLSPTQIANLPKHRVIVFRHGMPPVLGRAEKAWKRRDVRTEARSARRAAQAVLAEAAAVT
ncbi:MAG: type IV secretory system conjugative DNA transfer family protein, partial [Actinobacteria bacterium]|nr:type IV secretory system conjugative DNA transfer family protein [Actinomycetota bacterium]